MKNFIIAVSFFTILSLPTIVFSQDSTSTSRDSVYSDSTLMKCPLCGYKNKITNINCTACGTSLKLEYKKDTSNTISPTESTVSTTENTVAKNTPIKKGEQYFGFKIYIPMEKEVLMGENPLPLTFGFGGSLIFEKMDKFGMGWCFDLGYYQSSNNVLLYGYTYKGLQFVNIEYGYEGLKIQTSYKWKESGVPFWTSIGCPILIGEIFVNADELDTNGRGNMIGVGGDFSIGADINSKNQIFFSPQLGIQLIPSRCDVAGYSGKTFLLSFQMRLAVNFKK
jgi:hypothetical protein